MNGQKVFGIAAIVILLGLGGFKYYQYKNPERFKDKAPTEVVAASSNTSTEPVTTPVGSGVSSTAQVKVGVPISGARLGVIEIGASGFNSFVVNIDKEDNWEIVTKQFGKSLAYEGFLTTEDAWNGIKDYIGDIAEKGVKGKDIHFLMSSGALKNEKNKLIADAIEKKGYVVNRVTADQEGKYALRALLPPEYKQNSFVVDIGSGNTKISWYEGNALKSVECPGAKYYEKSLTDAVVYEQVKTAVSKLPADHRVNCFIIGGVPYELAKKVRNGSDRFTLLDNPDNYNAGDNVKLKSGLNIYRALQDGTGCNTFIFDWDANFTIGFLLLSN